MLNVAPRIELIIASRVTAVPDFHPEAGPTFSGFPVHVFLIHHPTGPILVDTGVGFGSADIDGWYQPESVDLRSELTDRGINPDGSLTIINTHLHFDHCGQNNSFPSAQIVVQRSEAEMVTTPFYTIREWAALPESRTIRVDGDHDLAEGIQLLHTPGHTPGHQSVVVRCDDETIVIAGQCLYRSTEWTSAHLTADDTAKRDATESLNRLRALRPSRVYLSHDETLTSLRKQELDHDD
jgi:N-acyl homoserine lactone hydrolase